MPCTSTDLDQFVSISDSLGGPGSPACNDFWAGFTYEPRHQVDQSLDPFSEAYVADQVVLYEEISGRKYDVQKNELTEFDVALHIMAANPYNHPDPTVLAVHLQRLSRALRYAAPQRGEVLLDMGCGWGLSSELAAYLGLSVVAVDVNPSFIHLVRERAKSGKRTIAAEVATFESFSPAEPADIALFYECLHHAVRPWIVAARIAAGLKHGGRIVLAGEPINDIWWKHWGMRLDPISVYCIRKFGWFESGWSLAFIKQVLHRAGFTPRSYQSDDPELGYVVIGDKLERHNVPAAAIAGLFATSGSVFDDKFLIFSGAGSLTLSFPVEMHTAVLNVVNFRGRELRVLIADGEKMLFQANMRPGETTITVPQQEQPSDLRLEVERWMPDEETHSGDRRILGLHLQSIDFLP